MAVGVVNLGASSATATVKASDLPLGGAVKHARDLWSHKDVAFQGGSFTSEVPTHGVLLLRVSVQ